MMSMSSLRPVTRMMGAPAGAGRVREPRDVAGAVADHRQRLPGERGDDELAGSADGQRLHRVGIDDFEQEMVFPAMQAVLLDVTLAGDAGAEDFRQAVDVDRLDAEPRFEVAAHRLAPR